jgi:hypothetical protein
MSGQTFLLLTLQLYIDRYVKINKSVKLLIYAGTVSPFSAERVAGERGRQRVGGRRGRGIVLVGAAK